MLKQLRRCCDAYQSLLIGIILVVFFEFSNSKAVPQQSQDDAPGSSVGILAVNWSHPFRSEGEFLRIGISPAGHFGDFRLGSIEGSGIGFQYPKGFEHAAVAWWGEGFTIGYTAEGTPYYATSYESGPEARKVFIADAIVRDTDGPTGEAVYGSVVRTEDGKIEVTHRFLFPKASKFVILRVTIRNIGTKTLDGVRYRRIWDFDMDNTVNSRDRFHVDESRHMLYAWESHYAALAASSSTPPTEWDIWAWDDRDTYLPGPRIEKGPFPPDGVAGDYNVRLEWVYDTLVPGASKQIVVYFIGGDNKADLDESYKQAEDKLKRGFNCKTGVNYIQFEMDSPLIVDQVCPAHKDNYDRGKGPRSQDIENTPLWVVIHNTACLGNNGTAIERCQTIESGIQDFQTKRGSKATAHFLVGPNGEVVQMVSEKDRAYHADANKRKLKLRLGDGEDKDREINSSNSIGIEIVGDSRMRDWPSAAIYQATAALVRDIQRRAKEARRDIELSRSYIIGHEEINRAAKWDPGPMWDWELFIQDYVGGIYEPAMYIESAAYCGVSESTCSSANRGKDVIEVKLTARANGRDGLKLERSENGGDYIETNRLDDKSASYHDNPALIPLVDKQPRISIGGRYCYRVKAFVKRYKGRELDNGRIEQDYVNPSEERAAGSASVDVGAPDIDVTPTNLDFGNQRRGTISQPRDVTIKNTGAALLTLKSVSSDNRAFLVTWPRECSKFPCSILPNSSLIFKVRAKPRELGTITGNLHIVSSDPDETIVDITLTVNGIATTAPSVLISLDFAGIKLDFRDETVKAQVDIFDLSGCRVFESGEVHGSTLTWNLQNNAGQPLANGVYLYVVRVRGYDGREYVSEVRKLVILR